MRNIKTPRFQQRHYEVIAPLFAQARKDLGINPPHSATIPIRDLEDSFIAMFKADNPKFNPERFRKVANQ